ncbi:glycoside hydrolase family 25 protein [Caproicibacterium lactatifermentans]|nr:glycoside hydrolase family 25 protein [Caproicibacterium lactatifermentans]
MKGQFKKLLFILVLGAAIQTAVFPASAADSSSQKSGTVSSAASSALTTASATEQQTASTTIKSDTNSDFSVEQGKEYTFRFEVVGPQGLTPTFTISGSAFQKSGQTQAVENGHDVYYYKIKAVGNAGDTADIYTQLPGQTAVKRCTVTVKETSVPATIKSDTNSDFSIVQGKEYTFRFEVVGPQSITPTFTISGSAFRKSGQTQTVENGHDVYYYKIKAVGSAGQASAVYTQLPGQTAVKRCTVTVKGTASIKSDTNSDFSVEQGKEYTFRFEVVGPQGLTPTFTISGSAFQKSGQTQTVENGHDVYYYKIKAVGNAGDTADIYTQLPGQTAVKRCAVTVQGAASIKSDTNSDFSVAQGKEYTFRFEVVGPQGLTPTFTISGSAFQKSGQTQRVENGHDVYYYKIKAVGSAGQTSAVYTQLPGQTAVKRCTVTVQGAASIKSDTNSDFSVAQGKEYTFRFEVVGPQGLTPTFTILGSAFQKSGQTQTVENGHDVYYYKIKAVGSAGQASAVYTQLPGQTAVKRCAVTVKETSVPATIKSDTNSDFSIAQGKEYTFRFEVVGPQGLTPTFTISGSAFRKSGQTQRVENGHDVYYYKIKAVGNAGDTADIYTQLPGQTAVKRCAVTVQGAASIKSDTNSDFSVEQGKEYTFRFEVVGPQGLTPTFTISGSAFQKSGQTQTVENNHDVYYYKIKAVGNAGDTADIYTQLPGQTAVKRCAVTVQGAASIKSDTNSDFSVEQGKEYTFRFEVVGPQGLTPTFTISGSAFQKSGQTQTVENNHDVYYYKIKAVGNAGDTADIYTQLPGQSAVKSCTAVVKITTTTPMKGIDVSEHNGYVDWDTAKAAGLQFAMIRCGYGGDIESQDDAQFERNVSECERLGIPWGTYLYSYALTTDNAKSELAHVLRLLEGKHPQFPVFIDMEDADDYKAKRGMPDSETLTEIMKIFCSGVKDAGYLAGYYVNLDWYKNYINPEELSDYLFWYARPGLDEPDKTCSIWQSEFPGTGGSWDGANISSGGCDMDVSYVDFTTWKQDNT